MSAPFFDPALILGALSTALVDTGAVDAVREIWSGDETNESAERRRPDGQRVLLVSALETGVIGERGLGNGRLVTDRLGVVIQLRHPRADDVARATLRDLRAAVFATLEGARLDPDWAPLRYEGGGLLLAKEEPGLMRRWLEIYSTETPAPVRL